MQGSSRFVNYPLEDSEQTDAWLDNEECQIRASEFIKER